MNNDISGKLTSYKGIREHAAKNFAHVKNSTECAKISEETYVTAQKCYDAMGHAKVSMDNPVSNTVSSSLEILKKDPQYVQSYIEFCDSLKDRGYSLEDAIIKTDNVFESLKQESTYKS